MVSTSAVSNDPISRSMPPSSTNREVAAVSRSVQYITAPRIKELLIYLQALIVLTSQSRSWNYLPPKKTSLFPNSPLPK